MPDENVFCAALRISNVLVKVYVCVKDVYITILYKYQK